MNKYGNKSNQNKWSKLLINKSHKTRCENAIHSDKHIVKSYKTYSKLMDVSKLINHKQTNSQNFLYNISMNEIKAKTEITQIAHTSKIFTNRFQKFVI